jgi:hypothetical protein
MFYVTLLFENQNTHLHIDTIFPLQKKRANSFILILIIKPNGELPLSLGCLAIDQIP